MAVENKYVDSLVAAGKVGVALAPQQVFAVPVTFELAAADDDGSIYRLLKNVNPDLIPIKIEVFCDTVTSGTDYDLGVYEPLERGGAVIDKDCFMDGQTLATAKSFADAPLAGLGIVNIDSARKRIWEHAGHTQSTKKVGYDIALTGNTVGSAAVTVTVIFWFIQG